MPNWGGSEGGLAKDHTFSGFCFVHPSLIILASHTILFSFFLNVFGTTCVSQMYCSTLWKPMNYSIHPKVKSNHMNEEQLSQNKFINVGQREIRLHSHHDF